MISPTQQKKLERLAKVLDNGDIALLAELDTLEGRLEAVEGIVPALREAQDGYTPEKGKDYTDGYTPVKGKDYFDGEDYVLTEKDKREIAKSITVPVVEKVIEKTIIKEVPIVTNEIIEKTVEVAVIDEATVAYLEDEIRRIEESIPSIVKQKETNFGFVIRDVVAGTGVTIDKTDPNRPIVNATSIPVSLTAPENPSVGALWVDIS